MPIIPAGDWRGSQYFTSGHQRIITEPQASALRAKSILASMDWAVTICAMWLARTMPPSTVHPCGTAIEKAPSLGSRTRWKSSAAGLTAMGTSGDRLRDARTQDNRMGGRPVSSRAAGERRRVGQRRRRAFGLVGAGPLVPGLEVGHGHLEGHLGGRRGSSPAFVPAIGQETVGSSASRCGAQHSVMLMARPPVEVSSPPPSKTVKRMPLG